MIIKFVCAKISAHANKDVRENAGVDPRILTSGEW